MCGGAAVLSAAQPQADMSPGHASRLLSDSIALVSCDIAASVSVQGGRGEQRTVTLKPTCAVPGPNLSRMTVSDVQHALIMVVCDGVTCQSYFPWLVKFMHERFILKFLIE